jgi:hypothetical protein
MIFDGGGNPLHNGGKEGITNDLVRALVQHKGNCPGALPREVLGRRIRNIVQCPRSIENTLAGIRTNGDAGDIVQDKRDGRARNSCCLGNLPHGDTLLSHRSP